MNFMLLLALLNLLSRKSFYLSAEVTGTPLEILIRRVIKILCKNSSDNEFEKTTGNCCRTLIFFLQIIGNTTPFTFTSHIYFLANISHTPFECISPTYKLTTCRVDPMT